MGKQKYWVVGLTHTDLAWKKGREEMAEIFDAFVIRLLDILDTEPSFTYMIEQATHYRDLAQRRPDLLKRLIPHIQSGRVEMVGGVAASQDTNIPNGESYIRNQLLGMSWVKANMGVEIKSGMLIDTFGFHPQMPQILKQFGISRILANRFGGNQLHDVFISQGLDGSQVLFVGRDSLAPYVKPGHVYFEYTREWAPIDQLFEKAAQAEGDGPYLVTAYTENEVLPSERPLHWVKQLNGNDDEWRFSTLASFMDALEATGKEWPVVHGDLNPEFTGTFSLRNELRLWNRKAEVQLLEAEKWAVLNHMEGAKALIDEAWWEMSYIQFHDVLTGSHPTSVYIDCLHRLQQVEQNAYALLRRALLLSESNLSPNDTVEVTLVNGLPWGRQDTARFPLPEGWQGLSRISAGYHDLPYSIEGRTIKLKTELPAIGVKTITLVKGLAPTATPTVFTDAILENEFIRLECDSHYIIKRLIWKPTNQLLMLDAGDLIVLQQDQGNFQIEEPIGAEIPAIAGDYRIHSVSSTSLGQSVTINGQFPEIPWLSGKDTGLGWELEFFLAADKPYLDLKLRLNWKGEQSRIRVKLTSTLDNAEGYFDTPFGVVQRKPYRERYSARGEWPVHRFAAIDNGEYGIALANLGTAGVEVNGGTLWTTVLRAPMKEYAGMVPDETSSEHGKHLREFRLMPYGGSWKQSGIIESAQAFNNPILAFYGTTASEMEQDNLSFMTLQRGTTVLSTVKYAEDGSDELIIRFYDAAGLGETIELSLPDAKEAWLSNLKEDRLERIHFDHAKLEVPVHPYEIKTIRVLRH